MTITYSSAGNTTVVNNPPVTLLTPYTSVNHPAFFTSRVAYDNRYENNFTGNGALPICFDNPTDLIEIDLKYSNNPHMNGSIDGRNYVNPGWELRALIYNSDPDTKLPSTLFLDLGAQFVDNADNIGEEGFVTWGQNAYFLANHVYWVLIVGQPKKSDDLPNGWDINEKYVYDTIWHADPAGGYVKSPSVESFTNNLDPIQNLPTPLDQIFMFGNTIGKNGVANTGFGPVFDYTMFGAPPAIDLRTATPPSSWPGYHDNIIGADYTHVATPHAIAPYIMVTLD